MTSCNGCDATWGGLNTCHCAAKGCHRTFTGINTFDKHRRRGKCLNPGEVVDKHGNRVLRLTDRAYPCWGSMVEMPEFWDKGDIAGTVMGDD